MLALALVLIAMVGLAISWLITGKFNYRLGSCGKNPDQLNRDKSCGNEKSCSLCQKNTLKHDNEEETGND